MRIDGLAFALVLGIVVGCGGQQDLTGTYEGRLAIQNEQGITSYRVRAGVSGKLARFSFALRDRDSDREIANVSVRTYPVQKALTIQSKIFSKHGELRLTAAGTCASAASTASYEAELCATGGVITLTFRDDAETIYLQAYGGGSGDEDELNPGPYTIPELAEIAKSKNLDVLLKAQELYRAREEVLLRRGNLFPNFNLGTILAAAESPFGLLSQVGNLLPFLFPDNWYRLAASKDLKLAQEFSYKSLKANQVNIVAGVSLMVLKDQALGNAMRAHMADLNGLLEKVQLLIKAGQAPTSWEQIVRMRLIANEEDLVAYDKFLFEQIVDLQKLLGAKPNKLGITVVPVPLPDVGPSLVQDLAKEEAEAIAQSPELKATIFLEQAARKMTKAVTWSWLNPNTDPRFNLGLGLEHAINIEKSHVEDVRLKRTETDHVIRGNIIDIERGIKFLVDQYEIARRGEEAAKAGLKSAMTQFELAQLGLLDTIEFVEQLFKYRAKKLSAQFTYLLVRDRLDRHTLTGLYADLPLPGDGKRARRNEIAERN